MPTVKKPSKARVAIRGKNWKRTPTIAQDKYDVMSKAILKALTTEPIAYTAMVKRIKATLKNFDGSISWYAIICLRELETRGKVIRHEKPVGYSRK
ncbi:MAG TPA: hypothetical protein PLN21_12610 [Gemmatales bacterium]|nr:hypothetical protein [Gemmatales bacterium]